MDLTKPITDRPIHFSGIGGGAMNGLALILASRGFTVRGTDPGISKETEEKLLLAGISVCEKQDGGFVAPDTQLVIATAALSEDNADLAEARRRGIPIIKYAKALGAIMPEGRGIAVAGTHGKTTTTSMLVRAMREAGVSPGFLIGSNVADLGGSAGGGSSDWFVAEACEYDRSFLNLSPRVAIVTGIEEDHLDIYSGIDDIVSTFARLLERIPEDGLIVFDSRCEMTRRAFSGARGRLVSCAIQGEADYLATGIRPRRDATAFEISPPKGAGSFPVRLRLPGLHNVSNALMAFAAGHSLGLDPARLATGLGNLSGIARRFEHLGTRLGVDFIDDYAHHPTEIRALVSAARSRYPDRRIVLAFQPHQISRTQHFFDQFSTAFAGVDLLLVGDVYAARDSSTTDPSDLGRRLAEAISKEGTNAVHGGDLSSMRSRSIGALEDGDVFITAGAGSITNLGRRILNDS